MAAAALGAGQRRLRHALADQQHVAHVHRQMPARVELAAAVGLDVAEADLELLDLVQRLLHLLAGADDADQVVHRLLQLGVQGVGVLRLGAVPADR